MILKSKLVIIPILLLSACAVKPSIKAPPSLPACVPPNITFINCSVPGDKLASIDTNLSGIEMVQSIILSKKQDERYIDCSDINTGSYKSAFQYWNKCITEQQKLYNDSVKDLKVKANENK